MENFLSIGGHRDGLEIPLAEDVEFIQLADGDTGRETYIRDTFAVGALASFTFYRHEKLTPEQVLDRLVGHCKTWAVNLPGGRR
jgi:hypothetical protein